MRKSNNPKLILLTGHAGSGKTHACLAELIGILRNPENRLSREVLYILPNAEHRERIVDLLLRQSGRTGTALASRASHDSSELRQSIPGFFGNVISTFDEMLDSLLRFSEIEFASDVTRQLILKEICQTSDLKYFRDSAQTRGFVELISGAISELKEALISITECEAIAANLKKKFFHYKEKYDDVLLIYSKYEKQLGELQLKDRHDALFLFEEKLRSGEVNLNRFHFNNIWIDGFFDFSNLQLSFIRLLAAYSDRMVVTLTHDPSPSRSHMFLVPTETRKALIEIGFQEQKMSNQFHRSERKTLRHLQENLFSDGVPKVELVDSGIQILEATGMAGELEMIAREIKKIALAEKINFSDFALLFRNVSPYSGALRSVFSKYGIPIEIHEREELRLNPLAKAFVSVLKVFLDGWLREDIFNFLKSGYIEVDRDFVWECERMSLREGLMNGKKNWLERFPSGPFALLGKIEERLERASGDAQLAGAIRSMIKDLGLSEIDVELTEENQKDYAALRRLDALLIEMCRKHHDESIDFRSFAEGLIRLIEIDLFAFHARDKNRVQIYNVSLARQKEYRIVFVPGLLEKNFPVQIKEDPIFSDAERATVNDRGVILRERLPRQSLEKFFFYSAVTRASDALYLTYPRFDLEGKEALPSFYVEEVKALFLSEVSLCRESVADILPPLERATTEREAAAHVVQYLWQRETAHNSLNREANIICYNHLRNAEWFQNLIKMLTSPIEGVLRDGRIHQILSEQNQVMTASRLETYAECPYRFFADYALKLQEDEDEIDSKVVGNILHDVLQHFHEWWKGAGVVSFEIAKSKCLELLQSAMTLNPLMGDYWYRIEIQKRRIEDMLLRAIELEVSRGESPVEKLIPEYFEYEFGKDGDFLIIQKDGRSVPIRGKIDRIDVDTTKTYGLVIDYKTGKKFEAKSLKRGIQLQLPIYILAAEQKKGLKALGGHLYSLSKTSSGGFHHKERLDALGIKEHWKTLWSESDWNQLFNQVSRRILDHTDAIYAGKIDVKPRHCAEFCPYSSVCRIEKWKLASIYRELDARDQTQYHAENIA